MKTTVLLLALAMAPMCLAAPSPKGPQGNPQMRAQMKERILAKFDADGDGELNEEERAAAKASRENSNRPGAGQGPKAQGSAKGPQGKMGGMTAMRAKIHARVLEYFDADGDGKLNEEERAALKEKHQETIQEFDEDGDGKLTGEERRNMMKSKPLQNS